MPRSASAAVSRELARRKLGDPRLRAMMSLRADFFGELQKDEPLDATRTGSSASRRCARRSCARW